MGGKASHVADDTEDEDLEPPKRKTIHHTVKAADESEDEDLEPPKKKKMHSTVRAADELEDEDFEPRKTKTVHSKVPSSVSLKRTHEISSAEKAAAKRLEGAEKS